MAEKKTSASAAKTSQLLHGAADSAVKLLQNPKVQEQIAQAASVVLEAIRKRSERRDAQRKQEDASAIGDDAEDQGRTLASRFGNQKLERRVENLAENVSLLRGSVGAEAADALGEVEAVVNRLRVAVAMAANLPMGKRQKAHWEIDSVLDELERAVFASVMQ